MIQYTCAHVYVAIILKVDHCKLNVGGSMYSTHSVAAAAIVFFFGNPLFFIFCILVKYCYDKAQENLLADILILMYS